MKQTFEAAFEQIKKLVEDFKANEKYYLSKDYQEAEVRKDYIDKFFIALGWDVHHDKQKNPYEQEVKVEKGVLVKGAQKRADYSFSLAPNYRETKFLVEAKKPARDLKNADDYFQTIRYGWHKQTPLGILTDFEEFHILDCRYGADINNALKKCYKEYHYSDYINEEKFAEIYWLFSREAVANNSIEKIAEILPKHKGKAAGKTMLSYETSQTIDDAFLLEIDIIREKLAKAFKKNDDELTSEELTEATQKTIDRLVFIRFLEDKLIEPAHYISYLGDKGNAWGEFIKLCRRLDAKYNGVVFKKHFIDEQKFIGAEENEFLKICKGISHLNSRFLFNEIPIHIIGSIYERFLGKEVHATDKRVQIEEKPEVRKAGGVYYTPKYIVDYIVNNTIGNLIEGKTPEQISEMRFADIACGSGSFLIGAYECLLRYHTKFYNEKLKDKKSITKESKDFGSCEYHDGQWNLTLKKKQNILLSNIYGVDIDAQAVEVTQLSLFLKLLEDETIGSTQNRQDVMFSKVLPDLSKNIICGNSLIGRDILKQNPSITTDEERKINPMDYETAFPEVFKNKTEKGYIFIPDVGIDEERDNDTNEVNDPMIPFKRKIKGGFDAIIGNPPYVNLVSIPEIQRNYFQKNFRTCKNKSDLYSFFIEKALNIVNDNSYKFGFIVPHTWLATESFSLLRQKLLNEKAIEQIAEMGFKVFEKVIVSTIILICSKNNKTIKVLNKDFSKRFEIKSDEWINDNFQIDLEWNNEKSGIYERLKYNTESLDKIIQFSRGIKTSDDKKFILKEKQNNDCYKIFRGRNIKSYQLNWDNEYIWYRPDLMKEKVGCLPHSKTFFEVPEKLITQRVNSSMQLLVAYDNEKNYFLDTTNVTRYETWDKKHSLKYICGLLNSKLLNYWYCNKYKMPTIGLYELHSIPIRTIDFSIKSEKEKHDHTVTLVEQMLESKKKFAEAKTDKDKNFYEQKCKSLDTQIDNLVYELYDLTEDEIAIIENKK